MDIVVPNFHQTYQTSSGCSPSQGLCLPLKGNTEEENPYLWQCMNCTIITFPSLFMQRENVIYTMKENLHWSCDTYLAEQENSS